MTHADPHASRATVSDGAGAVEWVSHPARRSPRKTTLFVAVVVLAAAGVGLEMQSAGWAAAAVAILCLGLFDFLLPTAYRMGPDGVAARIGPWRRRRPWSAIRSWHRDRNGVLLSPFPRRHRLEAFRGLYVRFDGNGEDVVAALRARLGDRGAR